MDQKDFTTIFEFLKAIRYKMKKQERLDKEKKNYPTTNFMVLISQFNQLEKKTQD